MTFAVLAALVAYLIMEPATYAAHRWIMHGVGWCLHRSHHRRTRPGTTLREQFEANDWFPVIFAGVTICAMAAGTASRPLHLLVPVGVGVTAYGATYAFVHDVYIHGRFARLRRVRLLDRLADAHALHHRYGGEPYGMLLPIVPAEIRARAAARPVSGATLRRPEAVSSR